jgi:porphobilinogen synthase
VTRIRPRRNRATPAVRALVREHRPGVSDLILPVFVREGAGSDPIASLPGVARHGLDSAADLARAAADLGIRAVALFPRIPDGLKDAHGSRAADPDGLVPRAVAAVKAAAPDLAVITDVALDPYSSIGHDGVAEGGRIANEPTVARLCAQAVAQARAGADVVAPSDMMDGRVGAIRDALDGAGFQDVLICSYAVKYASAFYGPFRDALDSAPRALDGIPRDKAGYQMDPANAREALREIALDEAEGADWVMVKPGLHYLDIIQRVRAATTLPVAAYHVSGEYAMLMAAAANGWLDRERCLVETATAFRRAGADLVFTYAAMDLARLLR